MMGPSPRWGTNNTVYDWSRAAGSCSLFKHCRNQIGNQWEILDMMSFTDVSCYLPPGKFMWDGNTHVPKHQMVGASCCWCFRNVGMTKKRPCKLVNWSFALLMGRDFLALTVWSRSGLRAWLGWFGLFFVFMIWPNVWPMEFCMTSSSKLWIFNFLLEQMLHCGDYYDHD